MLPVSYGSNKVKMLNFESENRTKSCVGVVASVCQLSTFDSGTVAKMSGQYRGHKPKMWHRKKEAFPRNVYSFCKKC